VKLVELLVHHETEWSRY